MWAYLVSLYYRKWLFRFKPLKYRVFYKEIEFHKWFVDYADDPYDLEEAHRRGQYLMKRHSAYVTKIVPIYRRHSQLMPADLDPVPFKWSMLKPGKSFIRRYAHILFLVVALLFLCFNVYMLVISIIAKHSTGS